MLEVAGRPMFELNPVATIIWEDMAAGLSTQEVIGRLVAVFNIPEEQAARDVMAFVEMLKQRLLASDDPQISL